ncbi:MAG: DUF3108 domain-containing protein [Steroidobacteraceae bacterium]
MQQVPVIGKGPRVAAALLLSAGCCAGSAFAAPAINPFEASYTVEWKGLNAGSTFIRLQRESDGRFLYSTTNRARGIFRLIVPDAIEQTSKLEITASGVRPFAYHAETGKAKAEKSIDLAFDWTKKRITGQAEGETVDLPLPDAAQDPLSNQIALIWAMQMGQAPTDYVLVDKNRANPYVYENEGPTRLRTSIGELDTVVIASHKPDSDRVTRLWLAPSLGYVPVRADRRRGRSVEWAMMIRSFTQSESR